MIELIFGKKTDVEKCEADLAALVKQRATVEFRLNAAVAQREAAREEWRDFLTGDDVDNSSLRSAIDKRVQSAESLVEGYRDALATIDLKIREAREKLSAARDMAAREAAADACDASAEKIENKVAFEVEPAIRGLVTALQNLHDVIPHGAGLRRYGPWGEREEMTASENVAAIVSEALYNALPDLFEVTGPPIGDSVNISLACLYRRRDGALHRSVPKHDNSIRFLPASGAADANLVKPLRELASAIRAGEIAPKLPFFQSPLAKVIEPSPFELVDVVFTKPVRWVAENGQVDGKIDSAFSVPKPVAAAAIGRGVAFPRDSEEARAHLDKRERWRVAASDCSEKFSEFVHLGVDLEKLMAAERARLNDWPAPADGGVDEQREASE
jgi:hypothetical protein